MAGDWQELTLQEAGVTLLDCVHKTPPDAGTGYPYVAIPQLKEGRVDLDCVRRITKEHFDEWTKKAKPRTHDVILSRRCNPGVTAYVDNELECALGQNLVLLRADGEYIFPPFLRWLCRGTEWWNQVGEFINVGATFESLKCAEIPKFSLTIPPLPEQKGIAEVLGALDSKIELNRRMNETLVSLARSLFKSWFVDFDPVRAKVDRRAPSAVSPEIDALFPDSIEIASDGETVPSGWRVLSLREAADFRSGGTPKKSNPEYWDGSLPWISPKVMNNIHVHDSDDRVTEAAVGNGTRLVPHGSVLVMVRGMGLHQGVRISQAQCDVTFNQDVKALVPTGVDDTFLLFAMLDASNYLHSRVRASGHGTGVLATEFLTELSFVVPPEDVLPKLVRPLKELNLRIAANTRESQTLATLRDTLLPKLLSGALRVGDAERLMEAGQHV